MANTKIYTSGHPLYLHNALPIFCGGCMFSRVANLIKGFFSLFISGVERRNPEALLDLEQENLRKQVANFNQGLATHAGMCRSEEHTSELQSLMRNSYAVFCLQKIKTYTNYMC